MRVFLCEHIHEKAYEYLESFAEIVSSFDEIGSVDAVINRNLNIDRAFIKRAERLKIIAVHGTGMDGVDLEAAKERGIAVVSAPHMNAASVAEHIVALTLALQRNIHKAIRLIDTGLEYPNSPAALMGHELGGKTFGLIGTGCIGLRAAKIFKDGFGMKVCAWSRSFDEKKAEEYGFEYCESIEQVFENADVINVGLALNEDTDGMIGFEQLRHAKPGAVLINTARGRIVDEPSLIRALKEGILAGAACDVFVNEPPLKSHPLLQCENFIATPHIGANTGEALYRVGMSVVEQIRQYMSGEKEENVNGHGNVQ